MHPLTQTMGMRTSRRTYLALITGCARASRSAAAYDLYRSREWRCVVACIVKLVQVLKPSFSTRNLVGLFRIATGVKGYCLQSLVSGVWSSARHSICRATATMQADVNPLTACRLLYSSHG